MGHVLIVDDEQSGAAALAVFLERTGGHTVARTQSAHEGLDAFASRRPDVVLLSASLPDTACIDVLRALAPEEPVVLMLASDGEGTGMAEALQHGAENFVTRPLDLPRVAVVVERGIEKARLRRVSRYLARQRGGGRDQASSLVGSSPTMRELAQQVTSVVHGDRATVLLVGERGIGKGRVAEFIHANGARASRPMVHLGCATVRSPQAEAELFGCEQVGDLRAGMPGLLETADGGTLFLDEIGALDPAVQPRLLRVLEGRSFRRVAGMQRISTRVRVIAATQRDLVNEVTAGRFQEDLYYRLSATPIYLPPLRARSREDLVELVASVLDDLALDLPEAPRRLADEALDRLLAYAWPGNVRELRNVLERAMLLARGQERIVPEQLAAEVRGALGAAGERHVARSLEDVEREHIHRTLAAHGGNRTHAARELGISRATLIKKIRQFQL